MKSGNFHLSIPCYSIKETIEFYRDKLKCNLGRNSTTWADVDLYGNQLTFMESKELNMNEGRYKFEGEVIPKFHFGVILDESAWQKRLAQMSEMDFVRNQSVEFLEGKSGHHLSFFVEDPNGYMIEFKCFVNPNEKFES